MLNVLKIPDVIRGLFESIGLAMCIISFIYSSAINSPKSPESPSFRTALQRVLLGGMIGVVFGILISIPKHFEVFGGCFYGVLGLNIFGVPLFLQRFIRNQPIGWNLRLDILILLGGLVILIGPIIFS